MRRQFFLLLTIVLCLHFQLGDGSGGSHDAGRVGCPHCRNDGAQISQLLQRADELYAAFKSNEALRELSRVLQLDPQNHEALSKTARVYMDFGDIISESEADWQERKLKQYQIAEEYARQAVKADPDSTWGHFYVAASLGKIALLSPVAKQVDLAEEIRAAVEKAIETDPKNGFAYHVYGVWHRKITEIGQMRRLLATAVLWRSVPDGSMEKSLEYLKKAVALNPLVVAHHLELARTYMAMGQWQAARSSLKTALELPIKFSDDPANKKTAEKLLQEIRDH